MLYSDASRVRECSFNRIVKSWENDPTCTFSYITYSSKGYYWSFWCQILFHTRFTVSPAISVNNLLLCGLPSSLMDIFIKRLINLLYIFLFIKTLKIMFSLMAQTTLIGKTLSNWFASCCPSPSVRSVLNAAVAPRHFIVEQQAPEAAFLKFKRQAFLKFRPKMSPWPLGYPRLDLT